MSEAHYVAARTKALKRPYTAQEFEQARALALADEQAMTCDLRTPRYTRILEKARLVREAELEVCI